MLSLESQHICQNLLLFCSLYTCNKSLNDWSLGEQSVNFVALVISKIF